MNFGKTTSIIISGGAFLYLLAQSTKLISSRIKAENKTFAAKSRNIRLECIICYSKKKQDSINELITCKICKELACVEKCSEFTNGYWECINCRKHSIVRQKTGEWFINQLTEFSAVSFEMALGDNILNLQTKEIGNREIISKVREIIEKCLVKILNGTDLDDTPVGKISESCEYLHVFKKYHHVLTSLIFKLEKSIHISLIYDLPSSSFINTDYVELKRFINRICQEVINISDTLEFSNDSVPKSSFDPQTYEELLATAVLNKITSDFLNKRKHGMCSQDNGEDLCATENEDFDFDSYNSKIQSHKISLPDLLNEFEDDFPNGKQKGSWEENWSLKDSMDYDHHKIAMLIPMPNHEVKTKIGDLDIDEISDISNKDDLFQETLDEVGEDNDNTFEEKAYEMSENELDNEVIFNDISGLASSRENIDEIFEQILITNEQNETFSGENDETLIKENNITQFNANSKYNSPLFTQYLVEPIKAIKVSDALKYNKDKASEIKKFTCQNDKKTIEIEPSLTIREEFVQTPIIYEKDKTQNKFKEIDDVPSYDDIKVVEIRPSLTMKQNVNDGFLESNENTPPIKGSIAEREHLKWLKAVPIENNPYSPEALQKRLSRSHNKFLDQSEMHPFNLLTKFSNDESKENISKYKRDYYINNSVSSTLPMNKNIYENDQTIENYNITDQTNESSLTVSDDSLTRIYTLSSQKTMILYPSYSSTLSSTQVVDNKENKICDEIVPLPSVKKLAEFYTNSENSLNSNTKNQEPLDIPVGISKITSKKYETSDVPAKPIASITARTLPPKLKEDLRKSLNPNDQAVVRHNERNKSPDIKHGLARSSISYFENFYK